MPILIEKGDLLISKSILKLILFKTPVKTIYR